MSRILLVLALCLPLLTADAPLDLLEAAKKGRTSDVEAFLAKGADIEMKDRDGRTPLMLAAQYGKVATVQLLLSKGARATTRDVHGWNAYMLALLDPAGGVAGVHVGRDKVLQLLPQPKRFRLQINASWLPSQAIFSSCFMRPGEMTAHVRDIRPDAMIAEAVQRYAVTSGHGMVAIVRVDARGTSEQSNLAPERDVDATLELTGEPGSSCVQGTDRLTMPIRAQLMAASGGEPFLDRRFGAGVKTGMKTENALNANQHAPLYQAWAKSQAGAIYWAVVEALLAHEW
jgi:hypothetical protein